MARKDRVLIGKITNSTLNRYYYPPKPKKPIQSKPRTKINAVSDKRKKENQEYSAERKDYLAEYPECEIRVEGCTQEATEVHHKKGRIGKLLTDKKYFCATCHNCHHWAEMNPIEAKEKGVTLNRNSK